MASLFLAPLPLLLLGCGPTGGAAAMSDLAMRPPDLVVRCQGDNQCQAPTPRCDLPSGRCVPCLSSRDCPLGQICKGLLCATGCSIEKGCGDAGVCDVDAGVCRSCGGDVDCPDPARPRCEVAAQRCVPCLPERDNCPDGTRCRRDNGAYACAAGCKVDGDCRRDGGAMACCDGACVDTAVTGEHCGKCGNACPLGRACCGGACLDLQGEAMNCGGCGVVCAPKNGAGACQKGKCAIAGCNPGFGDCDKDPATGCEANLQNDAKHCGACGAQCPAPPNGAASCVGGMCNQCACNPGFADCDRNCGNGCEVNLEADPRHCGGCGNLCPTPANGAAACAKGQCGLGGCNGAFKDCDRDPKNGCEADTGSDPGNCGACGQGCPKPPNGVARCQNGVCGGCACNAGFGDCDQSCANGCEVNLQSDVKSCGACGKACPAVANGFPGCAAGLCGIAQCSGQFRDCDKSAANGCETDTQTNLLHCGGCAQACPKVANATLGCVVGQCVISACQGKFKNCDGNVGNGCEADLAADPKNCGACGLVCAGPGCGTTVDAPMVKAPGEWSFNGSAFHDGATASAVLTPVSGGTGTVLYKSSVILDRVDIAFEFQIGGGSGADGMGLLFTTNGATAVGSGGGGLALAGLAGYGVEFDTYDNGACGDGNGNHLAVVSLAPCGGGAPSHLATVNNLPFALRNSGWHKVLVSLDNGVITVKLDGTTVVNAYPIQGFPVNQPYYVGFGGATGGLTDRHEVRNVKLSFGSPRCL